MNTPPKAFCHSCNGTGIDPTVGFLDCEFCKPSPAGVSLSPPEQPEPSCATCNDQGEIGCLRPDGYDGEHCPECSPATVKRYHVTEAGLVEGQALGRINVVLGADYDAAVEHIRELELLAGQEARSTALATDAGLRVVAERDDLAARLEQARDRKNSIVDLQQRLTAADERADRLEAGIRWETDRNALLLASLTEAEDMLSVTSLEAGQRITQLESLLSRWTDLLGVSAPGLRDETLAVLKPAEPQQCQFPQACTSNCPCKADEIPDFSPGNGNKARRRAEALGLTIPKAPTAYDGFDNGTD